MRRFVTPEEGERHYERLEAALDGARHALDEGAKVIAESQRIRSIVEQPSPPDAG
jgi:hypothetical protein